MTADATPLRRLMQAIADGDGSAVDALLAADPGLAMASLEAGATRQDAQANYLTGVGHYVYAGDTALHVAAAAYGADVARRLIALGADVAARNRRGAQPLHYAADGAPGSPRWNPQAQAKTMAVLIAAGAEPDATDMDGVTPLHRAVRTRCAAAVDAVLDGGADPRRANGSGSTPLQLATRQTGRGGSGSPAARAQQALILARLAPPVRTA